MNVSRIVAFAVGLAVLNGLLLGLEAPAYLSIPGAILAYLVTRFVGWQMTENRRIRDIKQHAFDRFRRRRPIDK